MRILLKNKFNQSAQSSSSGNNNKDSSRSAGGELTVPGEGIATGRSEEEGASPDSFQSDSSASFFGKENASSCANLGEPAPTFAAQRTLSTKKRRIGAGGSIEHCDRDRKKPAVSRKDSKVGAVGKMAVGKHLDSSSTPVARVSNGNEVDSCEASPLTAEVALETAASMGGGLTAPEGSQATSNVGRIEVRLSEPNPAEDEEDFGDDKAGPIDSLKVSGEQKKVSAVKKVICHEAYGVARGRTRSSSPCRDTDRDRMLDKQTLNLSVRRADASRSSGKVASASEAGRSDHSADQYAQLLKKKMGFDLVEQEGDGNCLFRAVAHQIYGHSNFHGELRRRVMDYMSQNEEHFAPFLTTSGCEGEPFAEYIARKRADGVHGNHVEIQAMSEMYNRPVEVYTPDDGVKPMNIFHSEYKTTDPPIRLSYHDGNHYDAIVDPSCPSAGLGLGLPGLQPGLADKLQMKDAVKESERAELDGIYINQALKQSEQEWEQRHREELMYKEKMAMLAAMDDAETSADFELEQALLESSMEAFHSQKKTSSRNRSSTSTSSSSRARGSRQHRRDVAPTHVSSRGPRSSPVTAGHGPSSGVATANSATSITTRSRSPSSPFGRTATAQGTAETWPSPSPSAAANTSAATATAGVATAARATTSTSDNGIYPETVTELVMNGFELGKVTRAYELIGDNFDDLLAFLMSSG